MSILLRHVFLSLTNGEETLAITRFRTHKVYSAWFGGQLQNDLSVKRFAIVTASAFLTGNISGHFVKYSIKTMIYLLPDHVTGRGPRTSTARRWKAELTGIGRSRARAFVLGFFRVAQSAQERTQCSTSLYIPFQ